MSALISATELKNIIEHSDVKIFDATYPHQSAEPVRISGAQIFDIDDIADPKATYKHTLPDAEVFQEKMRDLGINKNDRIIIYDQRGVFMAAARAWWMLRVFGHENVQVLNGGLPQWLAQGFEIEPMVETHPPRGDFTAGFNPDLVKDKSDILKNLKDKEFYVIDARAPDRFEGEGHIPNSHSQFFGGFIDPQTGMIRNDDDLSVYWQSTGLDENTPLAASCGSGVTACVNALALYELGIENVAVYDGSWTEWGSDPDTPKE